jgi:hypothetical protein
MTGAAGPWETGVDVARVLSSRPRIAGVIAGAIMISALLGALALAGLSAFTAASTTLRCLGVWCGHSEDAGRRGSRDPPGTTKP